MKKQRGRCGPRPQMWVIPDPLGHIQHVAWHRMRAQAHYRGEAWELSFNDYQKLWADHWHEKGRGRYEYCLVRRDYTQPWSLDNALCVQRIEHLRSQHRENYESTERN